jgi:hypothetical protein
LQSVADDGAGMVDSLQSPERTNLGSGGGPSADFFRKFFEGDFGVRRGRSQRGRRAPQQRLSTRVENAAGNVRIDAKSDGSPRQRGSQTLENKGFAPVHRKNSARSNAPMIARDAGGDDALHPTVGTSSISISGTHDKVRNACVARRR